MRRLPAGAPILTRAAMRAAEAAVFASGVTQDAVMERAGAAVAREVARLAAGRPALVLAGPGDNGGDAYVAARLLDAMGLDVAVTMLGRPKDGASSRMAARWRGSTTELSQASPRPVIVDGLLGIGTARPFDTSTGAAIAALLAAADLRIAVDVPSGVECDSGAGGITVDVTVALGALKPAHVLGDGASRSGHVLLADIGVASGSHWTTLAAPKIARPFAKASKFTRGMVVVVAGAMPGAAWLAASGALHGGAGYAVLAGTAPAEGVPHAIVRRTLGSPRDLEALLDDDRIGAVVVGPGLGRDQSARDLLDVALASYHPLVIDGDALTLIGHDVATLVGADRRSVCLTPHTGEFARMFDVGGSKIDHTLAAARESGAVVVHKGHDTVIGFPDGRAVIAAAGSSWLSTAGTGDVLAGVVAARLASGDPLEDAIPAAVWLHARAAELAGAGFAADRLITHLPAALAQSLLP